MLGILIPTFNTNVLHGCYAQLLLQFRVCKLLKL